jgi:hypothetical protein
MKKQTRKVTMNHRIYLLFISSILLTGCANFNKTVAYDKISNNETIIAGHLDINLIYERNGIIKSKRSAAPGKEASFAIKKYNDENGIGGLLIGYSGVERIIINKGGYFFVPISPGKYYIVDFFPHYEPDSPAYATERAFWTFDRQSNAINTLTLNIKPNAINYIGDIQFKRIFRSTTDYGDLTIFDIDTNDNFTSFRNDIIEKSNNKNIIQSIAKKKRL